jgi:hypothetical protein
MKTKIREITLIRKEGTPEECITVHGIDDYAEADEQLRLWSESAPIDGDSHNCLYVLIFEDNEIYEGVYQLRHSSCKCDEGNEINLREQIGQHCRFVAGLDRPEGMNDIQWARAKRTNKNRKKVYDNFLARYEV